MSKVKKKISLLLFVFIVFFVITIFPIGTLSQNKAVNIAEASFLDAIIAFVTINPLSIHISVPKEMNVERNFKAEAIVQNKGEERISNVEVEIFISEGLVLVNKNASKNTGNILGNREKKISWQVKGIETGNFSVSVRVSGIVKEDAISVEGNTAFITIKEKSLPPGRLSFISQNFFDFIKQLFQI